MSAGSSGCGPWCGRPSRAGSGTGPRGCGPSFGRPSGSGTRRSRGWRRSRLILLPAKSAPGAASHRDASQRPPAEGAEARAAAAGPRTGASGAHAARRAGRAAAHRGGARRVLRGQPSGGAADQPAPGRGAVVQVRAARTAVLHLRGAHRRPARAGSRPAGGIGLADGPPDRRPAESQRRLPNRGNPDC